MKRVKGCLLLLLATIIMGGCGKESAVTDWAQLSLHADEATSLQNSNLLNDGFLTWDGAGKIYFVDPSGSGIYVSGMLGEEKRLFSEETGRALQVADGWLYFKSDEGGIKRIQCDTGKAEVIREETCGEIYVANGMLYINGEEGFCRTELDGTDKVILRETSPDMVSYTTAGNYWIGNAINDVDAEWFWKGYLLVYDEESARISLIKEGAAYPLIAGNWLSVFDVNTVTRHVWDMETGEDIDLGVYAQKAVSDGKALYYTTVKSPNSLLCKWDGKESQTLFTAETEAVTHLYLTGDTLYWLQTIIVEEQKVQEWWYYELKTGEAGKL